MKRQIFIGDLQGCLDPLRRLLDRVRFDPSADRLRLAGDLVNRGGQSLETLRLVHSLRGSAMSVLGNHDLHLLAYACGRPRGGKRNKEFDRVLDAPDAAELLGWLRRQPLMWKSNRRRLVLVHAGVDPRWGPKTAQIRAREVEYALAQDAIHFFDHMYGDRPRRWRPGQPHHKRLRSITNVFTRMRFCDRDGRLDLESKGSPDNVPRGFRPWFEHLHADWTGWHIIFGHWSLLGLYQDERVTCLDSGCVWGGALTALIIDGQARRIESVDCRSR